jgi:hypothetical protein
MTENAKWKGVLREPNAIGWIAFLVLVLAIGVGTILFGGTPKSTDQQTLVTHAGGPRLAK